MRRSEKRWRRDRPKIGMRARNIAVLFVQRLHANFSVDFLAIARCLRYKDVPPALARALPSRHFGVSDSGGNLMTTESHFSAVRMLLLAAAWVGLLAGIAFAWAAVERRNIEPANAPHPPSALTR